MGWKYRLWDAMAAARDIEVRTINATSNSLDYEVRFRISLDRDTWTAVGVQAGKRRNRVVTMLRKAVAEALREFMSAEDDGAPAFADRVADKVAGRYGE